ncbi:hypothetical protein LX36DRAFT_704951 [Colletotrichum falcatum]|nr:hypothetical protein LX36DRAFT_704951 [Colletotrichum falcatum]
MLPLLLLLLLLLLLAAAAYPGAPGCIDLVQSAELVYMARREHLTFSTTTPQVSKEEGNGRVTSRPMSPCIVLYDHRTDGSGIPWRSKLWWDGMAISFLPSPSMSEGPYKEQVQQAGGPGGHQKEPLGRRRLSVDFAARPVVSEGIQQQQRRSICNPAG